MERNELWSAARDVAQKSAREVEKISARDVAKYSLRDVEKNSTGYSKNFQASRKKLCSIAQAEILPLKQSEDSLSHLKGAWKKSSFNKSFERFALNNEKASGSTWCSF